MIEHHGKISSFADPADVKSFLKWKAIYMDEGFTENQAIKKTFAKGDNGVGCYGDDTTEGSGLSCAVPPEDMIERWGSIAGAKHKQVNITIGEISVVAIVKDRMPRKEKITNGAVLDANPDTVKALGQQFPMLKQGKWSWVE